MSIAVAVIGAVVAVGSAIVGAVQKKKDRDLAIEMQEQQKIEQQRIENERISKEYWENFYKSGGELRGLRSLSDGAKKYYYPLTGSSIPSNINGLPKNEGESNNNFFGSSSSVSSNVFKFSNPIIVGLGILLISKII